MTEKREHPRHVGVQLGIPIKENDTGPQFGVSRRRTTVLNRSSIGLIAMIAWVLAAPSGALAHDESR